MLPVVFNEKMFDDFFDSDFFGGRNPLYGRHAKNLMKTDIREKEDGYEWLLICRVQQGRNQG